MVIMGETGCGKTRLIRYMCDLAKDNDKSKTNMIILKVKSLTNEVHLVGMFKGVVLWSWIIEVVTINIKSVSMLPS